MARLQDVAAAAVVVVVVVLGDQEESNVERGDSLKPEPGEEGPFEGAGDHLESGDLPRQ